MTAYRIKSCGCEVVTAPAGNDVQFCAMHEAAPSLLGALEVLYAQWADQWQDDEMSWDLAERAIAKAGGQAK